jgi:probable rRNA maturation factor
MAPIESSPVLFLRAPKSVSRRACRDFARQLIREVTEGRPFHCLITDDRELLRLNKQFLGKDYPTDVLSFPSPEPAGLLGEMAISAQRAAEQANEYGHSLEHEMRILMLHGVLHLLGMDHTSDRGRMRRAETRWRKKFELPAGLIERVRT